MKRFIVVAASNSWGDYPDLEVVGFFDDWLDAVKNMRREGIIIIDTHTEEEFDPDDEPVLKTKKEFKWYMDKTD